jgi:CD109 antigen
VKPGSDIEIAVSTRPNSSVSLLGVDQSVLLLKKGNDIEASTVFEELLKYGNTDKNYSFFHGGYNDFKEASAVVVTNAKKPFGELSFES